MQDILKKTCYVLIEDNQITRLVRCTVMCQYTHSHTKNSKNTKQAHTHSHKYSNKALDQGQGAMSVSY